MSVTFKSVDHMKQIAFPMWVGIVPSVEDPNRAKVWGRGGFEVSAWW